jgi:hypothetical protein
MPTEGEINVLLGIYCNAKESRLISGPAQKERRVNCRKRDFWSRLSRRAEDPSGAGGSTGT